LQLVAFFSIIFIIYLRHSLRLADGPWVVRLIVTAKTCSWGGVFCSIITLNYLGTAGKEAGLAGAITFSSPLNVFMGSDALEKWYNIALNKHLAQNLVKSVKRSEASQSAQWISVYNYGGVLLP
jgi:predicted alpha/beta-fold hydrolase